jgi:hypothetical protein
MKFYEFEPDTAGYYGDHTEYIGKRNDRPRLVTKLHYEFSYWPDDDMNMVDCIFHFIGTDKLKVRLEALSPPVTGVEFDQVEISGDDQEFERVWRKGRPYSALGKWHWFKITGQRGVDDFGCDDRVHLAISERVLDVINSLAPTNGTVFEYRGDAHKSDRAEIAE